VLYGEEIHERWAGTVVEVLVVGSFWGSSLYGVSGGRLVDFAVREIACRYFGSPLFCKPLFNDASFEAVDRLRKAMALFSRLRLLLHNNGRTFERSIFSRL